jgi:acyl-CoA thioesterase I
MNPVVLFFASGDSLYFGAVLLLLVIAISPYLNGRWMLRCRNIAAWAALALIVMACPPFSWMISTVFLGAFVMWFIGSNWTATGRVWIRARLIVTLVLALLLLVLPAIELSHRKMPEIVGVPSDHLVVIGDSISSGIGLRVPAWPLVMQEVTGVPAKNLPRAGADTIEAQSMAKEITPEDRVVLLEIGGNDLLAGVPSGEFGKALDVLLSKVSAPGRTVVMFELPLFPHKMAYGQIQRRLAERYGVWLIPKRFFVDVIGGAEATSDGLHLSDAGTHHMAALVAQVLSPVLKSPSR